MYKLQKVLSIQRKAWNLAKSFNLPSRSLMSKNSYSQSLCNNKERKFRFFNPNNVQLVRDFCVILIIRLTCLNFPSELNQNQAMEFLKI